MRWLTSILCVLGIWAGLLSPALAQSPNAPLRVLWWNGTADLPPEFFSHLREDMSEFLDAYGGGGVFDAVYRMDTRQGAFAAFMAGQDFDVIVLDLAAQRPTFNGADKDALRAFYASGHRAIMMDGTLTIRSMPFSSLTQFPGANGSSAGLLVNQILAVGAAGGGVMVGTDHDVFQTAANDAIAALVPGLRFSGRTNPSTDGDFIGTALLAQREAVSPRDLLRHWEDVPSQGEAPVGTFTDFTGAPVTMYALVETADKPGGGQRRPYISASFDPGDRRTAIDSTETIQDNMPTRKSPPVQ